MDLKAPDQPNIVSKVFRIKFEELLANLTKKHILGKVVAFMSHFLFQYKLKIIHWPFNNRIISYWNMFNFALFTDMYTIFFFIFFFFFSLFVQYFFSFWTFAFYTPFFSLFSFIIFFFCFVLFYFLFSTSHKKMKWRKQRNFHKSKYKSSTLVWNPLLKQFQGLFFSLKFRTTWFSTFWLAMSYQMKEGVKGSKRVTMDINAR